MPIRRHLLLAAGAALLLAVLGASLPAAPLLAQNACSAACKTAYGNCYKSSQDRPRCQAQLQRCLEACIRSKR